MIRFVEINFEKVFYLFLAILVPCFSSAQNRGAQRDTCADIYEVAQEYYEDGQLKLVIETLSPCFQDETSSRAEEIHELAVLSYLFLDDKAAAEKKLIELYNLFPFHQVDQLIPDLLYLDAGVIVYPGFELKVSGGGLIINRPIGFNTQAIPGQTLISEGYGTLGDDPFSFQGEVTGSFNLTQKGPFLNLGLGFTKNSFRYTGTYAGVTNPSGNTDQVTTTFRERLWVINVPVYISQYIRINQANIRNADWLPYVYGGFSLDLVNRRSARWIDPEVSYTNFEGGQALSFDDYQIGSLRQRGNASLFIGGGVKLRSGLHAFHIEARYGQYLRSLRRNNTEATTLTQQIQEDLHYRGGDFRLQNFTIFVGYSRLYFKVAKKR
ncbi:MAG: hypothetical protein AAF242_19000 [Bacteroidota bacterium]